MKKINKKNYFKLTLILLGTILATIVSANIYRNYYNNKISQSYLTKYIASIQYNEFPTAIVEQNSYSFIYLTYGGNKEIYNMEKYLKKAIFKYNLQDNFILVDMSDYNTDNYINEVNNIIKSSNKKIYKIPAIIYYKNNQPVDLIDSYTSELDAPKFIQLLEQYEITEQNA